MKRPESAGWESDKFGKSAKGARRADTRQVSFSGTPLDQSTTTYKTEDAKKQELFFWSIAPMTFTGNKGFTVLYSVSNWSRSVPDLVYCLVSSSGKSVAGCNDNEIIHPAHSAGSQGFQ